MVNPLVDAFFAYLKQNSDRVSKSGKTKEALTYALNQERYLRVFLENGDVPMDNNASKRAIRGFCIGKKNWEMIDTVNGATSSAIIYSIADKNSNFLEELLPWSETLPENIRKPQKTDEK